MSKIQFESKSQHYGDLVRNHLACKQLCQRYNLKANHNLRLQGIHLIPPVSNYVKDTI